LKTHTVLGAPGAPDAPSRIKGSAIQLLLLAGSALWICTGGPLHILALLLSGAALSLALVLLDGEKRRNAALHATLDRLSREVGVNYSGQD
jgi:hypothetical protein